MPHTPYYAVIFSSIRTDDADELYETTGKKFFALATQQPGYIGAESVSNGKNGITVTYWDTTENIKIWKRQIDHLVAQKMGRELFYERYHVRIARVEREYQWTKREVEEVEQ